MASITAGQLRKLQRGVHLLAGAGLLAYVYLPAAPELKDAVRFLIFPLLALTGIAMWQAPRIRRVLSGRSRRLDQRR